MPIIDDVLSKAESINMAKLSDALSLRLYNKIKFYCDCPLQNIVFMSAKDVLPLGIVGNKIKGILYFIFLLDNLQTLTVTSIIFDTANWDTTVLDVILPTINFIDYEINILLTS